MQKALCTSLILWQLTVFGQFGLVGDGEERFAPLHQLVPGERLQPGPGRGRGQPRRRGRVTALLPTPGGGTVSRERGGLVGR